MKFINISNIFTYRKITLSPLDITFYAILEEIFSYLPSSSDKLFLVENDGWTLFVRITFELYAINQHICL